MKKIILYSFIAFISFSVNAQNSNEFIAESSINFMIKNFGVNVDGHFKAFLITTQFNSNNELIDINATIKVKSIITGIQSRDEHILKEDYFFVEKYPEIVLNTIDIEKEDSQNYILKANLLVKGVSKKIKVPIHIEKVSNYYIIYSEFEINRKDFYVGKNSLVLGKKVKISVKSIQKM